MVLTHSLDHTKENLPRKRDGLWLDPCSIRIASKTLLTLQLISGGKIYFLQRMLAHIKEEKASQLSNSNIHRLSLKSLCLSTILVEIFQML